MKHYKFFKQAVIEQSEFSNFFVDIERLDELKDFSQSLIDALNSTPDKKVVPKSMLGHPEAGLSHLAGWIHALENDDHELIATLRTQNKNLDDFLKNNEVHGCIAAWILKENGLGGKQNTDLIFSNPNLQKAVIALGQTGVKFKDDWQQLKDDPDLHGCIAACLIFSNPNLQKAVIALGQTGVKFKDDWQQLKDDPALQKAVIKNDQELQKDYYPKLKKYEKHCLDNQSDNHPKWQEAKAFSQTARVCAKNYLMGLDNSFVPLQDTNDQMEKLSQHRDNLALRAAGTFALSLLGLPLVWGLGKAIVRSVQGKPFEFLFLGATESQKKAESIKSAAPAA